MHVVSVTSSGLTLGLTLQITTDGVEEVMEKTAELLEDIPP